MSSIFSLVYKKSHNSFWNKIIDVLSYNVKVRNKTILQNLCFHNFSWSWLCVYSHVIWHWREQNCRNSSFHVWHCFIANRKLVVKIVQFTLFYLFCQFILRFIHKHKFIWCSLSLFIIHKSFSFLECFITLWLFSLILTHIYRMVYIVSLKDLVLTWWVLLFLKDIECSISGQNKIRIIHINVGIFYGY